jgi:hypothetical protein
MAERLAEILVVVVARQGHDGSALLQERQEDLLEMFNGFAQAIWPTQLAEQVASDEEDIDLLYLAILSDAFNGSPQVGGAVDAAQTISQVPVGGV